MIKSKPLTAAQLRVLTAAAQRSDRLVLPLPPEQRARGGARPKLLATLMERELVQEVPVDDAEIAWRSAEGDCRLALRLTAAGWAAAGSPELGSVAPEDGTVTQPAAVPAGATSGAPALDTVSEAPARPSPAGKLGQVLEAISTEPGATLAEITVLTRWLPHTARAALTGLRQRGFSIQLVEQDGRKAYRRVGAG
jgi:hypothetical protein